MGLATSIRRLALKTLRRDLLGLEHNRKFRQDERKKKSRFTTRYTRNEKLTLRSAIVRAIRV